MFDPTAYGPEVASILGTGDRLAALGPGSPGPAMRPLLEQVKLSPACRSGLWLYHDFLDESHELSQALHTPEGSFWHAVMHRREPDAWNSKYWWRQVGGHPVLEQLRAAAPAVGYRYTTPEAFVDFCEAHRDRNTPDEATAKRVQLLEWRLLFDWCYRRAGG